MNEYSDSEETYIKVLKKRRTNADDIEVLELRVDKIDDKIDKIEKCINNIIKEIEEINQGFNMLVEKIINK